MFEVERSIRVLDGAVAIFDAVAGVQAQSETVWGQARRYSVPAIAYLNKMDRDGASFEHTVAMIASRLSALPIPIQLPLFEAGRFEGVIDLLDMQVVRWQDHNGSQVLRHSIYNGEEDALIAKAEKAREEMIDLIADRDEAVMEAFMASPSDLPSALLRGGLRRIVVASKAVPVLCGASFRNKGVQPLIDAVVDYLPSPLDRPAIDASDEKGNLVKISPHGGRSSPSQQEEPNFCALAFKVVHHHQKGLLVYFRVYSGTAKSGMLLHNTTLDSKVSLFSSPLTTGFLWKMFKERLSKILSIHGEDMEEISEVPVGHIAAAVGLKDTRTGDTLVAQNKNALAWKLSG